MPRTERKDARWNIRVAAEDADLVRQAASLCNRSLSDFVLRAAKMEADRVLGDRTRFSLDDAHRAEFLKVLDRPAEVNPGLAKLFATPISFE